MMTSEPKISVIGLAKSFGDKQVLRGIDLDVMPGESVVVVGGSGAGKTVFLKHLIGLVASNVDGGAYAQAHAGHAAGRSGATTEQILSVFEYETSPLFDDRERAALRFANDASQTPGVTNGHFEELRKHFSEEEIIEILSVVSLYGYLHRWNAAAATRLEDTPRAWAESVLAPHGWHPGEHR